MKSVLSALLIIVAPALTTPTIAQTDTTVTYQGELKTGGNLANGAFDMTFSKWDEMVGGGQVGPTLTINSVPVNQGRFTVNLDFGVEGFNQVMWLEIVVDGLTLSPRQQMTPAPVAINLVDVDRNADGAFSIGTSSHDARLHVQDILGDAIFGASTLGHGVAGFTASAFPSAGVQGVSSQPGGVGVFGDATNSTGVNYGVQGSILSTTSGAAGVYGHALAPNGNTRGGLFLNESSSNGASAIVAQALATSGQTFGVQASVSSDDGRAISGFVPNEKTGTAVMGSANNPSAYAGEFLGRVAMRDHTTIGSRLQITSQELFGIHSNTFSDFAGMYISTDGDVGKPFYGYSAGGNIDAYSYFEGSTDQWRLWCGSDRISVVKSSGNVGIGTTAPVFRLHVNGSAGKPGGGSWSNASDLRLKKNVESLAGALDLLLQIRGVTYEYKDPQAIDELPGRRIGVIAQDVENVFPDWVDQRADGYKAVTFRGFEALTVEAIRQLRDEHQQQMEHLAAIKNAKISKLENRVTALEAKVSQWIATQEESVK